MTTRRLAIAAGIVVLAVAGVAGALAFFSARDDATLSRPDGPGEVRPPGDDPPVSPGNVVLLYERTPLGEPLEALATDIAGEPGEALQAAGQAVLVQRATNLGAEVRAVTRDRQFDATGPDDPELRAFVEFWLGRTG